MPILATDDDVLAQIAMDDDEVAVVLAQMQALGPAVPPVTTASWNADLLAYRTWSGAAKVRLSGGFFGGEWFGVVADGNAAVAWQDRLQAYQSILGDVAAGKTPTSLAPPASSIGGVSDRNAGNVTAGATGALASASSSLAEPLKWVAIAAVAAAVAFVAFERK